MTYGTKPLDPDEYPREIVVSERVKATLVHRSYRVEFPYDRNAIEVAKDYGMIYSNREWSLDYMRVEGVRRAMEEIEAILVSKDPGPPRSEDTPEP